jgi:hypothetical protein
MFRKISLIFSESCGQQIEKMSIEGYFPYLEGFGRTFCFHPQRINKTNASSTLSEYILLTFRGSKSPRRCNRFLRNVSELLIDYPASYPVGTGDSFPWGKAAGREAGHSSPISA